MKNSKSLVESYNNLYNTVNEKFTDIDFKELDDIVYNIDNSLQKEFKKDYVDLPLVMFADDSVIRISFDNGNSLAIFISKDSNKNYKIAKIIKKGTFDNSVEKVINGISKKEFKKSTLLETFLKNLVLELVKNLEI